MSPGPHISEMLSDVLRSLDEDGTDVVFTWNEWPDPTARDPVTQARLGTPIPRTATLKAFIHFVNHAQVDYVRFNEIETGNVILDLAPDADIDGKEDAEFNIAGRFYVQKAISGELAESWDALVTGEKLLRSVLLRKKT